MGNITKSLWTNIKHAVHAIPLSTDLVPFADHLPGTDLVTQINECTVAELVAAGSGGTPAVDIGLRRATITLNDAQIKALPSAPLVVAAGVPGKAIGTITSIYKVNTLAGAYTNINAAAAFGFVTGQFRVSQIFENVAASGATVASDLLGGTVQSTWGAVGPDAQFIGKADLVTGVVTGSTYPINVNDWSAFGADLTLVFNNAGSGPLTGGNAANSMVIQVLYWIA